MKIVIRTHLCTIKVIKINTIEKLKHFLVNDNYLDNFLVILDFIELMEIFVVSSIKQLIQINFTAMDLSTMLTIETESIVKNVQDEHN